MQEVIPSEYRGWWRIVETSQWVSDGLDLPDPPPKGAEWIDAYRRWARRK